MMKYIMLSAIVLCVFAGANGVSAVNSSKNKMIKEGSDVEVSFCSYGNDVCFDGAKCGFGRWNECIRIRENTSVIIYHNHSSTSSAVLATFGTADCDILKPTPQPVINNKTVTCGKCNTLYGYGLASYTVFCKTNSAVSLLSSNPQNSILIAIVSLLLLTIF